jgi:hypothetical protein
LGHILPCLNPFFETAHSVLDFAIKLSGILSAANSNLKDVGLGARFTSAKPLADRNIERPWDYQSQINAFLATRFYAQPEFILKLKSDEHIIQIIDKIASDIYSNLKQQEIYGDISSKDITKIVACHIEKIVNAHRIPLENFDYSSAKSIENSKKIAHSMQHILDNDW